MRMILNSLLASCTMAAFAWAEAPQASAVHTRLLPHALVTSATSADVRDVFILLEEGPLHGRFHLSLNGISLTSARAAYVDDLLKSLDTNGDGKLSAAEAARSPLRKSRGLAPPDHLIPTTDADHAKHRRELQTQVDMVGGDIVNYQQDRAAAAYDLQVFKFFDSDNSGFIEAPEMAAAAARIMERDKDRNECLSFEEFKPSPQADDLPPHLMGTTPKNPRTDLIVDASLPRLVPTLLARYDTNQDGRLSAAELGWDAERTRFLDQNGDGKLDERELAGIATTRIDLELAVNMGGPENGQPAFFVLGTTGKRIDEAQRPGLVRLVFPKVALTLSFRNTDPIQVAVADAGEKFEKIDKDNNGYVDREEARNTILAERGLFDQIDQDGDGMIFGTELEKFVRQRGELRANTASLGLFDMGRGFFDALDADSDGKISVREMKRAGKVLQKMARNNPFQLGPTDPVRTIRLEFGRGGFALFRPVDPKLVENSPSFEPQPATGPIWFQRMDRNQDGDLTWNEFLGPREAFHRIDTDGDGLIDPQEAGAVEEE
ncbi:MAG: EF-hand domain-containing protein [Planctomycetes bacterium]|nr:EF-hand domain-containing protein [Planctomycetota bacterium]